MRFSTKPALGPAYLKLLFDRRPPEVPEGVQTARIEATLEGVAADPDQLAGYNRVCGFEPGPFLPITYPHVMIAGVHLRMLQDPRFPTRAAGLVHVWQKIRQHAALPCDSQLDFLAWIEGSQRTDTGEEFCLNTELTVGGQMCWSGQTGFVALSKTRARTSAPTVEAPDKSEQAFPLDVPSDIGRRYARVSGDYNPIHLTRLSARLFGFRTPIAHGMWSLARCASFLDPCGDRGKSLEARFIRPLFLPAEASVLAQASGRETRFRFASVDGKRLFVKGSLTTS